MKVRGDIVTAVISVNMGSKEKAKKAFQALIPEARSKLTGRSEVSLKLRGDVLVLTFRGSDVSALRAPVNSFCRWVSLLQRIFNVLDEFSGSQKRHEL